MRSAAYKKQGAPDWGHLASNLCLLHGQRRIQKTRRSRLAVPYHLIYACYMRSTAYKK
jgi:hypothetical protein